MCKKDEAIFSVSFLNYWVLSGSMGGKNALMLAGHAFGMIQDNRIKPIERSSILTVLTLLLRMSLIKLVPEVLEYLKKYAFLEFAAVDRDYSVQRKDKAMFLIQELLAGGYALDLSLSELGMVKQFAVQRLAYPYGGPMFKRDIIELLSLIVEKEELFSFDLVKSFECIRDHVVKGGERHNPLMIQRIVRTFDRFLEHPDETVRFLAAEISLSIGGYSSG